MPELHYRVEAAEPESHRFRITLHIEAPDGAGQLVSLAAWTPGSYMIRDHARNVVRMVVHRGGEELIPGKLDKQTWRLPDGEQPLDVVYEVHAWDRSVRAAYLDLQRGFFDGASLFLRVHGQEKTACSVELVAPVHPACTGWRVATALPAARQHARGFGTYRVPDHAELIDHPVEMGSFEEIHWQVGEIPHRMALTGRYRMDGERLARDLEKICAAEIRLFGEAPFSSYLFQTNVTVNGYGGLEHRASTALICMRDSLPAPGMGEADDKYREFLGLCSHEYFHAWNVKRIRPQVFMDADLSCETYTRLLWVFEGFTSYYDDLLLVRSGVISAESYLELLGRTITRVLRGAGRELQSVADSSFDAWTRFYKQDACSTNLIVSYYAKGALVALALDLLIRRETQHARSLDDVMRYLWQNHGALDHGVPEDAMVSVIKAATGVDVTAEVAAWALGTEDPPLAELLEPHGVCLNLRADTALSDRGGKAAESSPGRPAAGMRCETVQGFAVVRLVQDGSPAGRAGLAPEDVLIAVDGVRVKAEDLEALVARCRVGDALQVHYLREDLLYETQLELQAPRDTVAWLAITEENAALRWLQGKSSASVAAAATE